MRKFLATLAVCLLASSSLMASWSSWSAWTQDLFQCDSCGGCCGEDWPSPFDIKLGWGYRQDKFNWSIAGHRKRPRVLSELKWRDLRISQIGGEASYVSWRNYAVYIAGDYGHIYHGRNKDADFLSNRRRGLYSLSKNDAGKGHVYDLNAGVGYRVTSTCARLVATPLIGYAWHGQELHIFNGNQVVDTINCQLGPFPGLNSKYKARWYGPWIGVDFTTQVECCAYLFGNFEWHQTTYRAKGCWNLRSDLGPFRHKAYGHGYVLTLGANWELCSHWSLGVVGNYRNFRTGSGRESVEVIHGPNCVERFTAHFNGAKWVSWSISGIVAWRW